MRLQGGKDLKARLAALKVAWKPHARAWGRADVKENRARVPVRTGRLRKSFRVSSVSGKRAIVRGHFTAYFIDAGVQPHMIKPKKARSLVFEGRGGSTIFARKADHRGFRSRPFRKAAALAALRKEPQAQYYIDEWNRAA